MATAGLNPVVPNSGALVPHPLPWRHEPGEAPSEHYIPRLAGDVVLLQGMPRDHPAGLINIPQQAPRQGALARRRAA